MESGMIYKSISAIMKEVPAIGKNNRNAQQGFNYRSIDDVMNALQNILPKYGVFYVPEVIESHREERQTAKGGTLLYSVLKVRYTFYAEDGSSVAAVVQSEGMDSADKSSNKAMSAACKYALFQVFNIPTIETVDPDAETPEPSKPVRTVQSTEKPAVKGMAYPGDDVFMQAFELPKNFHTVLTLADAETITDSKGEFYGSKSLEKLYYTLGALQKRMEVNGLSPEEQEQIQDKVDAIFLIFDNNKKTGKWKKQG